MYIPLLLVLFPTYNFNSYHFVLLSTEDDRRFCRNMSYKLKSFVVFFKVILSPSNSLFFSFPKQYNTIIQYILNWAFQGQWNTTKQRNRITTTATTVKNPNLREANLLAIYKCTWKVEPGTPRIKFNEWSERGLEPGISGFQGKCPNHSASSLRCQNSAPLFIGPIMLIVWYGNFFLCTNRLILHRLALCATETSIRKYFVSHGIGLLLWIGWILNLRYPYHLIW